MVLVAGCLLAEAQVESGPPNLQEMHLLLLQYRSVLLFPISGLHRRCWRASCYSRWGQPRMARSAVSWPPSASTLPTAALAEATRYWTM